MGECTNCKHHPLYPTITLSDGVGDVYAEVKFRQGVYLDTPDGLTRVLPSSRMKLSYTALKEILVAEMEAIFYFIGQSERSFFIEIYPEYATWNL